MTGREIIFFGPCKTLAPSAPVMLGAGCPPFQVPRFTHLKHLLNKKKVPLIAIIIGHSKVLKGQKNEAGALGKTL